MNIFFPKEPEYESRVSLTLESAKKFLDKGLDVSIEKSFAEHLGSSNKDFEDLGVKVSSRDEGFSNAEIICSVRNISEEELDKIKAGSLCRSERVAKYNQILRIEENLGKKAKMNKL